MTPPRFRVVQLDVQLDRSEFHSGSKPLDTYFHRQVTQDIRRRITACFMALNQDGQIAGFYTLASSSINLSDLPEDIGKKLPRYPSVPAVHMGRLAVDERYKGLGLGGALLADALARILDADIAAFALIVDAKDEKAATFYQHHGMIAFPSTPLRLFLPMAAARNLVN
ncbi:MAG: GNAT family N-acetyltransferase [Burkholderiaceae bacterium]